MKGNVVAIQNAKHKQDPYQTHGNKERAIRVMPHDHSHQSFNSSIHGIIAKQSTPINANAMPFVIWSYALQYKRRSS